MYYRDVIKESFYRRGGRPKVLEGVILLDIFLQELTFSNSGVQLWVVRCSSVLWRSSVLVVLLLCISNIRNDSWVDTQSSNDQSSFQGNYLGF